MMNSEFMRFVVVGGFAAGVNIVSRYVINYVISYQYAIVIAYVMGMITAFYLSKVFVFATAERDQAHKQFFRFTLVNIAAAAQVWLISVGLAEYFFPYIKFSYHPYDIAHCIGVICPVFTSFVGHKYFSFRA
jgi:putative flippase GtrA